MPIRTVVPLPGPFVYVGASRGQRLLEAEAKERDRARREARKSDVEKGIQVVLVAVFVAFVLVAGFLSAAWYAGPVWFVLAVMVIVGAPCAAVIRRRRASR